MQNLNSKYKGRENSTFHCVIVHMSLMIKENDTLLLVLMNLGDNKSKREIKNISKSQNSTT